jgi:PP-loop superfamily ATP-utilizing enzyme
MNEPEYNSELANSAQFKMCKEKDYPHFAPPRTCYACKRDIFQPFTRKMRNYEGKEVEVTSGIKVADAGNSHITGCPHCHYSYCD